VVDGLAIRVETARPVLQASSRTRRCSRIGSASHACTGGSGRNREAR
jgi:hypothetical protein